MIFASVLHFLNEVFPFWRPFSIVRGVFARPSQNQEAQLHSSPISKANLKIPVEVFQIEGLFTYRS